MRTGGNDASAGTTPATAWRTWAKSLGAVGIASGDTLYVGAGIYRDVFPVSMVSATVETFVIGDVDGAQTGDVGEVILTNYQFGLNETPNISSFCMSLNGRDNLTFRNIHIFTGGVCVPIDATTLSSVNIKLDNCLVVAYGAATPLEVTAAYATPLNWTITRSQIIAMNGTNQGYGMILRATYGTGADYDLNFQVTDSLVWGLTGACYCGGSGTVLANKGGGIDFSRCTLIGMIVTSGTNLSTTIPCAMYGNLSMGDIMFQAGTLGNISDVGYNVGNGSYTNVTKHASSRNSSDLFPPPILSFAHEWMWGMQPRRFLAPMMPGALNRISIGAANTDMENRARGDGSAYVAYSGTATAGAASTITDTGAAWKTDEHVGRLCRINGGTGAGQVQQISANTATVLTISKDGPWQVVPAAGSQYIIYDGPPCASLKPASGTISTYVVTGANWTVNKWAGSFLNITAGAQVGVSRFVLSNTANTLTTQNFPGALDATSLGYVAWNGLNLTSGAQAHGALDLHDDARFETTVTDVGGTGIVFSGQGSTDYTIPVDAVATTISVRSRYDPITTGTKPQALLLANGEVGVSAQTLTVTAAADTWQTLTFAPFTPTAKGVVTLRLWARSAPPYGKTYFDTVAIA